MVARVPLRQVLEDVIIGSGEGGAFSLLWRRGSKLP